jgi:hypothetical protein
MQKWNTGYISKIIYNKFGHKYLIKNIEFGGDHDTNEIYVERSDANGSCSIQGWLLSDYFWESQNRDDCDVEMILVNHDRYGTVNASPEDLRVIADITEALKQNGFSVSNEGWKSFF